MELNKWTKSTRSGNNGNCTEVRLNPDGSRSVRDSKNPGAAVLTFTASEWLSFIEGVKQGEFD